MNCFCIVSRGLGHRQVKEYMIISGYGLLLFITANQHQVLQLNPYPPFGLPTICYLGLASYLILIGVYSSALSVANDVELRRSIRRSVERNVGVAREYRKLNLKTCSKENTIQFVMASYSVPLYPIATQLVKIRS